MQNKRTYLNALTIFVFIFAFADRVSHAAHISFTAGTIIASATAMAALAVYLYIR